MPETPLVKTINKMRKKMCYRTMLVCDICGTGAKVDTVSVPDSLQFAIYLLEQGWTTWSKEIVCGSCVKADAKEQKKGKEKA